MNHEQRTRNQEPFFTYTGPSMNPTLKPGDRLRVVPYCGRKIRVGDVVVIHSPDREKHVVHRVVSVDSQGIRTRGDNNSNIDPWPLRPEDIIGRIDRAERKNRTKKICAGLRGRIYVSGFRAMKQADSMVSGILHPAYRWFAKSGVFKKFLPQQMKPQVLCFKGSNFTEMQLLIGSRVVGRLLPGQDRWHIRRPYRLFIDELTLPKASNIEQQHLTC
jgi:signal peptidase I